MATFEEMTARGHERVSYFRDPRTGVRAIVAIHSTALGNTLGGVRRWHYPTEAAALTDVLRLSEAMTSKAAAAGLPIGGGKSVILVDRPRKPASESEARAMGRFVDTLKGVYVAAEDVGVDTRFLDWMLLETDHVAGGSDPARGGDPSPHTARGVVHGMRACMRFLGRGGSLDGVTVAIQGVGKVGARVARLLRDAGARVVASDVDTRLLGRAARELGIEIVGPEEILTRKCDILAPCALGGVIDARRIPDLRCRVVCGCANNILVDPGEDARVLQTAGILYAPDFVVNAGGLIQLACRYLDLPPGASAEKIAEIEFTTARILEEGQSLRSTHAAALQLVRERLSGKSKSVVHAGETELA